MGKKKNRFLESAKLNSATFDFYMRRLTDLAVSCFEWENLPETVDPRFLEISLFSKGVVVWFIEPDIGMLAMTTTLNGEFDVYNTPIYRVAYAANGFRRELDMTNSVLMFNNYMRTPTFLDMELYALRLYEIERGVDVNIKGQKTPKILTCSENQRLVLENLYMQYSGNFPFIFGEKGLDVSALKSIDTASPFVADKLQTVKRQIFNEALTFLGIENNSDEKAERLVTNEAISNIGAVDAQRAVRLNARLDACKRINDMFGTNINVKFRRPLSIDVTIPEPQEDL